MSTFYCFNRYLYRRLIFSVFCLWREKTFISITDLISTVHHDKMGTTNLIITYWTTSEPKFSLDSYNILIFEFWWNEKTKNSWVINQINVQSQNVKILWTVILWQIEHLTKSVWLCVFNCSIYFYLLIYVVKCFSTHIKCKFHSVIPLNFHKHYIINFSNWFFNFGMLFFMNFPTYVWKISKCLKRYWQLF